MNGPCAKVQVCCTIITTDNQRFVGENVCRNPQPTCPRLPGEDYTKCKTVCDQVSHAEVAAVKAAGCESRGSTAYVEYAYVCEKCKHHCQIHGVRVVIGAPPNA